jgi:hypothetical protein
LRGQIGRHAHDRGRPQGLAPLIDQTNHSGAFWQGRFDRLEDLLKRLDQ